MSISKIKKLLGCRERWTRGENARNRFGDSVDPRGPEAVCWCLNGAAAKCGDHRRDSAVLRAAVMELGTGRSYPDYNDTHTYYDVMSLLDRAEEIEAIYVA